MGLSDAVTVGIGDNDGRGLMEGRFDGAGDTVGKRLGGSDGFWVGGFVVVGSKVGGWLGVKLGWADRGPDGASDGIRDNDGRAVRGADVFAVGSAGDGDGLSASVEFLVELAFRTEMEAESSDKESSRAAKANVAKR